MTIELLDTQTSGSARIHVLREKWLDGTLSTAVEAALDVVAPDWKTDRSDQRWHREADAAADWYAEHGTVPEIDTPGAAGIRIWLNRQSPATTTASQLRRLEGMPGWPATIYDADSAPAWAVCAALTAAGATPTRPEDRVGGAWQINEWMHDGGQPADIDIDGFERGILNRLLDISLHIARYGRIPAVNEPAGTWYRREQIRHSTAAEWINTSLSTVSACTVSASFRRGRARFEKFVQGHGRVPSARAAAHEERFCGRWYARARAAVKAGSVDASELPCW